MYKRTVRIHLFGSVLIEYSKEHIVKKIRLAQILRNCYYEVSTKKALRAMQQVSCTRTRESVHARPHYGQSCHILSKNYDRFLICI